MIHIDHRKQYNVNEDERWVCGTRKLTSTVTGGLYPMGRATIRNSNVYLEHSRTANRPFLELSKTRLQCTADQFGR